LKLLDNDDDYYFNENDGKLHFSYILKAYATEIRLFLPQIFNLKEESEKWERIYFCSRRK